MITFAPLCTLPEAASGFVKAPNVRSTMDIVWSSLAIILLCNWSILHLNVPPQFRLPTPKSRWETLRRIFFTTWFSIQRKLVWMVVTIFIPEVVLSVAVTTFVQGRKHTKEMIEFQVENKAENEIEWTITHSMYANMGGFVLKFPQPDMLGVERQHGGSHEIFDPLRNEIKRSLNQFSNNNKQGYKPIGSFDWDTHETNFSLAEKHIRGHADDVLTDGTSRCARQLSGDTWTLTRPQILECRRVGIIRDLPNITENEILDKSKSDAVVTLLALGQVVWLIVQLSTRTAEGKLSSQIEITALAFATCAIVTYYLLYNQPKDVKTPTVAVAVRCATQEEFSRIAALGVVSMWVSSDDDIYSFQALRNGYDAHAGYSFSLIMRLVFFGSMHLLAWNMKFPTQAEQLIWRICALTITCLPLIGTFIAALALPVLIFCKRVLHLRKMDTAYYNALDTMADALSFVSLVAFVIARSFLLVEAFRSTYYLLPNSYMATWASNIPHVA